MGVLATEDRLEFLPRATAIGRFAGGSWHFKAVKKLPCSCKKHPWDVEQGGELDRH
jgi:hypothetical protein